MTRDQIEAKILALQHMAARETDPSTLATINRCIERLVMMEAEDE